MPQRSLSDLSQINTPSIEFKNSLHGSNASLNDDMEIQEASSSAPSTVEKDLKKRIKTEEIWTWFINHEQKILMQKAKERSD